MEAVKLLAQRAGMPEPTEDDKTGRLRSRILTMNKDAARFFHACLNSTVEEARQARAYWRRRGLDDKTINASGWATPPTTGRRSTSISGTRATTNRSWTPAACSSGASRAASTACSGGGS